MGETKLKRREMAAKKKNKKKKKALKITLIIVVAIALFATGVFGYLWLQLGKLNTTNISKTNEDLGISESAQAKEDEEIVNVAFFGLDRENSKAVGRSDSTMILSIDKKHKKIKMISIMRDTYVKIKDNGQSKLNHSYAYGGPQLAIRTLNENFDMNIRDFVAVDFFKLEEIINELGGVEINVKPDEVKYINQHMIEVAEVEHKKIISVTKSGKQTLNGMQTVSYARIRHTGNGDFERTERQRTVLTALLNKIKSGGATQFSSNVSKLLPYVETSLSSMDIVKLGTSAFTSGTTNLDQERFPIDGYCKDITIDGTWYLQADMQATKDQLHKYIYDDVKPVPGKPFF